MRTLNRIVVGFDPSDRGLDALNLGELLGRTMGAELLAVRIDQRPDSDASSELEAELDDLLGEARAGYRSLHLNERSPAKALCRVAEGDPAIGLIAVGSTHRAGFGRVMPGGVGQQLLADAPCAIAFAPRGYARTSGAGAYAEDLRVVGAGYDGSVESKAAVALAAEIATAARATIRVIAVGHPEPPSPGAGTAPVNPGPANVVDLQSRLHEVTGALAPELRALPVFARATPAQELLNQAEQGVDLLLVGSRGRGPLGSAMLGSTSAAVLARAPCPVIVSARSAVRT